VTQPILVINPNSTEAVTEGIHRALDPLRMKDGPLIECLTLAEGPPGIETQAHVDGVVEPLLRAIRAREDSASAFVIACYSDPGLEPARSTTRKPVFGIAESAMVVALTRGQRFGIVSILETSIPRHARAVAASGLDSRFAGDVAIGVPVTGLANEEEVWTRLLAAGESLRDRHSADVLILGCAGMARYRARLENALERPVVDPTQAAVTLAIGAVRLLPSK
jgi:Asp/Glu/hydantoin racemase